MATSITKGQKESHRPIPSTICSYCGGKGSRPLRGELLRTFNVLRIGGEYCAADLAQILGWQGKVTAMNNRLNKLLAAGFLSRRLVGKTLLYRLEKPYR